MRRVVALLTDFGADAFYVGVMRGVVAAAAPDASLVDVTHSIPAQAVAQAGFVLDRVFDYFPRGSVFVAVVDPGVGGERRDIVVSLAGRHVVCPDNGLAGELAARVGHARVVVIDGDAVAGFRSHAPGGRTFLGRDVFAPAGAALAAGVDPTSLGPAAAGLAEIADLPRVTTEGGRLRGSARFVDPFGTLLTNVTAGHVAAAFGPPPYEGVEVTAAGRPVGPLLRTYGQRPPGTLMAILDSWDLVEIAVNRGRAIDRFDAGSRVEDIDVELRRAGG